jgi:hypothetical protein
MFLKEITYTDEETGDEVTAEVPHKNEVCGRCEGHGTHLNPNIGGHAYTMEEFNESFDDEEREEYFKRGGRYDVTCEACGGNKVVAVPTEEGATPEQKAHIKAWEESEERSARYDAEDRRTRWMEDGCPMD